VGGLGTCATCHIFEFLFFFSSFASSPRAQVPIGTIYTSKLVFPTMMCLLGSQQNPTTFREPTPLPKKTSPKWAGIGISQPIIGEVVKYGSHISVTNEDIRENVTDRLITKGTI